MKALVTGATGFVGSHIAERLVAEGHSVRSLVRQGSDVAFLRALGVELCRGALEDEASLLSACRGVDVVHHNAARVGDWGRQEEFVEVDVRGTARMVAAAQRAGVKRFVHMSSVSVYGFLRIRKRHVTESLPPAPRPWRWDYYGRAKAAAERVVLQAQQGGRIETVILRPSVVYGPRDRAVLPRLVQLLRERKLRIIGSGENRPHLVYAGDVADASFRAATREQAAGGIYQLDGRRDFTQREFFEAMAEIAGEPPPAISWPLSLAYLIALASEARGHWGRTADPPALTRYVVILSRGESDFDLTRAAEDLGWLPRTCFAEGLQRTRASYRLALQAAA